MIRWVRVGVFEEMTFEWKAWGATDRGGGCLVIGNDGGGGKEMVRSSGGRSFQRRDAVMDMARLENMKTKTKMGDRAFEVAGPRNWNSLPATIREIKTLPAFKKQLKLYLIGNPEY